MRADRQSMVEIIRRMASFRFLNIGVGSMARRRNISISAEVIQIEKYTAFSLYIVDVSLNAAPPSKKLREREEIFRGIVTQGQDSICLIDPETLKFVEIPMMPQFSNSVINAMILQTHDGQRHCTSAR